MKNMIHGGDLGYAAKNFDIPISDWIDLSTGINPYAYDNFNAGEFCASLNLNALPQQASETHCRDAMRHYYQCDLDGRNFLLAPGSQILISQLPYVIGKSHIYIPAPTYSEHEISWRNAGHKVSNQTLNWENISDRDLFFQDNLVILEDDGHLLLVNPNNPDGRLLPKELLIAIADHKAKQQKFLIVDEAFIDIYPDSSVTSYAGHKGLIILRSFGKFFGLAGLRLGT
ncbi:MAG: aminotransferase class I/II-fold pyridoxal phosphate-dependent enzyme, partial [Alphaproteobacteria bacterium]|nr:aminotransferase class I/II-fold pyridoxal phosphate-dependent enzyme [Alphaproteobacteria bacterium]